MGRVHGSKDITEDGKHVLLRWRTQGLLIHMHTIITVCRDKLLRIFVRRSRIAGLSTIQKRGWKPKLSDREIRMLRNHARDSRFKPPHTIVPKFKNNSGIEI